LGDQGDRAAGGEAPDRPRTYTVWLIALGLVLNGLYHSFVAVQSLSLSFLAWAALSLASAWGIWQLRGFLILWWVAVAIHTFRLFSPRPR